MRIRQIKPSFWEDATLDPLPDSVKLFYIGTWQLADDGGTLEWRVAEIGRALYGYHPRHRRERWVEERGAALENIGRLVIHDCGHAVVPRLAKHQHLPGKPVTSITQSHAKCSSPQIPADVRGATQSPATEGVGKGVVNGKGGVGGFEKNDDALGELRRLVADPSTSEAARRAAEKTLSRMGAVA